MRLPDFLVIGAMKAGTSSLHHYLNQHPQVFTSEPKELNFFTREYHRGIEWYMQHFHTSVAGESSPNYLKAHLWPETAARIHQHLPDARLVCMLRNPVDRTLSHYLHAVWRGQETRPFSEAIRARKNFLRTSRYGWQLDHYLAHFPADQIMLVGTDRLDQEPAATTRQVLRFIGVNGTATTIDTSSRHNVTAYHLKRAVVPDDPAIVVDAGKPRLSPEARAALADELRPELERLAATWPQFAGWDL